MNQLFPRLRFAVWKPWNSIMELGLDTLLPQNVKVSHQGITNNCLKPKKLGGFLICQGSLSYKR